MNVNGSSSFLVARKVWKIQAWTGTWTLNPDLCDAGAVLHQLSYQANWELVVTLVNDKQLDDRNRSIQIIWS